MKKRKFSTENISDGFHTGSRNWLLHARYVRGEHALCHELSDQLQKQYDNKHRYAHYIKGSVLADAGRLQEALERYHSCIRLHPQDPEPLKQVGKCLSRQQRFQLSNEAYLEADKLTKHPDPDIYCALAECSWNLGSLERGVEWARSAVQAGGGERAAALLAKLLLACDDVHGALAAYDQALTTHACGADTLAAAGALRLRAGDPRRAFQLLGAALAQQPTQHAAALALAAMMLQHKDLDAALARLKAALTAHPTCVAAHVNLGMALLAKKKYIAALTCLQRACWAAPLSARAAHDLGLALLVCKRPASAFCRLATAAALQPFQPYTDAPVTENCTEDMVLIQENICNHVDTDSIAQENYTPIVQIDNDSLMFLLLRKMESIEETLKTMNTNYLEHTKAQQNYNKVLNDNLQTVMLGMSDVTVQIEQAVTQISRPAEEKQETDSIQLITCHEDLQKFEILLDDPDAEAKLKNRFGVICGKGKGRGINNAYTLVDSMFDRSFLLMCSWAGGSRTAEEKICFKSHTKILNFFFNIVHESDNTFSVIECHNFFKNILKNSRQRNESKQVRTSATKNRPKLKRSKENDQQPSASIAGTSAQENCEQLSPSVVRTCSKDDRQVLLIGIALERLEDSRADAAYSRAAALARDDPLITLNLAARHARAGRLPDAVEEAGLTAQLLQKEDKPDAQLASSLATLLALLRDAGVEISLPTSIPDAEAEVPASVEVTEKEQFATDEV